MRNSVVKIIRDEDGTLIEKPKWCLVVSFTGSPQALCSGHVFGYGEGSAEYEHKVDGKVTCSHCLEMIKWFKKVKL